jgi:hypothetical protein
MRTHDITDIFNSIEQIAQARLRCQFAFLDPRKSPSGDQHDLLLSFCLKLLNGCARWQ